MRIITSCTKLLSRFFAVFDSYYHFLKLIFRQTDMKSKISKKWTTVKCFRDLGVYYPLAEFKKSILASLWYNIAKNVWYHLFILQFWGVLRIEEENSWNISNPEKILNQQHMLFMENIDFKIWLNLTWPWPALRQKSSLMTS